MKILYSNLVYKYLSHMLENKYISNEQIDISAVADMNKSVETNRSATTKNEEQEKNSNGYYQQVIQNTQIEKIYTT